MRNKIPTFPFSILRRAFLPSSLTSCWGESNLFRRVKAWEVNSEYDTRVHTCGGSWTARWLSGSNNNKIKMLCKYNIPVQALADTQGKKLHSLFF